MPIYEQTYRSYDGELRRHFRWWTIVRQEWRILRKSRLFWVLSIPSIFHVVFWVVYIYAYHASKALDSVAVQEFRQSVSILNVDADTFWRFLFAQSFFVFLTTIFAGAGLICNDFRYNLVEVYFSKPLSWLDYAMGKIMILVLIGLSLTAFPALFLLLLHLLFAQDIATLKEAYWLPLPIMLFSLCLVLPCSLAVLASSSFFNSQRFAAIALFTLLTIDSIFGGILPELLRSRGDGLRVIAFPVAVRRIGEAVFQRPNLIFDVSLTASIVFVAAVCLLSFWIVCRKVRQAGATA